MRICAIASQVRVVASRVIDNVCVKQCVRVMQRAPFVSLRKSNGSRVDNTLNGREQKLRLSLRLDRATQLVEQARHILAHTVVRAIWHCCAPLCAPRRSYDV